MNKGFQVLDQYWCRHTSPHEVSGAQCLSRRLILAVFQLVFVFRLGGPTPSEAAGGRPLTEKSKTDGPAKPVGKCSTCGTQHLQVQSTFNMFQHLEGSADNMLSTFAVVTRPAMDEPLEMAKQAGKWSQIVPNRPKIVQNRLKSLKIARFLHLRLTTQDQTSTFTTFTRPQGPPGQHSTLLPTFATNGVNIQHQQLRRFDQRFPTWLVMKGGDSRRSAKV